MAVLQKGQSNPLFWGSTINIITGLDPLGLQVTSEATYSALLPGISNLTNRLRYYGFYCWLLHFYFQKEQKGNSSEQYRFIRRAELMIAIIMKSQRKEILQITGSTFAANLLDNDHSDIFDLAEGADKEEGKTKVYWKYPSGAFGQYYYGAMHALSLVASAMNEEGDVIYKITEPNPRQKVSGKQLAEAFDATLPIEIKTLFYSNIKKGRLDIKDAPILIKYFAIEKINPLSEEWKLYAQMLLDKDDPSQETEDYFTFHRKQTILSLLESVKSEKNKLDWYNFLLDCYRKQLGYPSSSSQQTQIGWYCYHINEYWQYACGTVFWSVLQYLYSLHREQYLPSFIKEFSNSIIDEINRDIDITSSDSVNKLFDLIKKCWKEEDLIVEIDESIRKTEPYLAAKYGFLLLFQLYINNVHQLHELKAYSSRNQMIRDGNSFDGLIDLSNSTNLSLQEFIEQFLIKKIIYRHQMVALRKMGYGTQSTHKFFIEDQFIRFIDVFPPRNTSPRMYALCNLLFDLGVIDENNELAPLHEQIIAF
jgi:hypothetical protein